MRRAFFASALFLLVAGSASAADQACPALTLNLDAAAPTFMAKTPPPPPPGPCTVSCWADATITCSSQVGDCHHASAKGAEWITCDGATQLCPDLL